MLVYMFCLYKDFFIYMHDLQFINFVDSMLLLCLDPVGSVSRGQRYQGLNLCLAVGILFELFCLDYFTYWTLHHCTGQLTLITPRDYSTNYMTMVI